MPAIQVARTDTFEIQRQKINQIGDQIFTISAGGSDLATGNLKLGDGTVTVPSLGFTSLASLGLYRNENGGLGFVTSGKKIIDYDINSVSFYKDVNIQKRQIDATQVSILTVGQNYDTGDYSNVPLTGGAGTGGTADLNVIAFDGSITNAGSGYIPGNYAGVELSDGSTATFTVDGISGDITNAGSGYLNGTYLDVPVTGGNGSNALATVEIVGSISSTGSVTSGGSGYAEATYQGVSLRNVPLQTYVITAVANPGTPPPTNVYAVGGSTQQSLTLVRGNTYRFDISDASNSGHNFILRQNDGNRSFLDLNYFLENKVGNDGDAGAFVELIIKEGAPLGTIIYDCEPHVGMGATITIIDGTAGNSGSGATADIDVNASGQVSAVTITALGSEYTSNDTLTADSIALGGGSGFVYTLSNVSYTGTVTAFTVTQQGSGYQTNDVISFDETQAGNVGGSGFQYTITSNPYSISTFDFDTRDTGNSVGTVISLPTGVTGLTTTLPGAVTGLSTTLSTASDQITVTSVAGIQVGMFVTLQAGNVGDLPAGTTVDSIINATTIRLSANPTLDGAAVLDFTSPDLTTITVSSIAGIEVGDLITVTSGTGVLATNTTVDAVDSLGNTITLSVAPTTPGPATLSFTKAFGSGSPAFAYTVNVLGPISGFAINNGGNGYLENDLLSVDATDLVQPIDRVVTVVDVQSLTLQGTVASSVISVGDEVTTGTATGEVYAVFSTGGNIDSILIESINLTDGDTFTVVGGGATVYTVLTAGLLSQRYLIDGAVTPNLTLYVNNTYKFDLSDSSNSTSEFALSRYRDGSFEPSLVTGVNAVLSTATAVVTVPSSTGILAGMEVSVASGAGSVINGTKVLSVDSATQITLDKLPLTSGAASMSFNGVEYTDGVTRVSGDLIFKVTDSTPTTLYYYSTTAANYGGSDSLEGIITVDPNNPKTFGSGFQIRANNIIETNTIAANILDGELTLSNVISGNCAFTVGTITTLNTSTLNGDEAVFTRISSGSGGSDALEISAYNTNFTGGDVSVGTRIDMVSSTGNITTSGDIQTTGRLLISDKLIVQNQTVTSTAGYDVVISPYGGRLARIATNTALVIPAGIDGDKPQGALAVDGAIRFNTTTNQYEGYSSASSAWSSLGGVRDIDGNTYILAEESTGANDNTLWFYNDGTLTMKYTASQMQFINNKKVVSLSVSAPAYSSWVSNFPVTAGEYVRYRNNLYEVTQSGNLGTSGSEPTHTSGAVLNGTAELTWSQLAVGPLTFDEMEEFRVGPVGDLPLVVNSDLRFANNTISTDISDIVLQPNTGKKIVCDTNTTFAVPVGTTGERGVPVTGSIRYNTTNLTYEGYDGTNWGSLGGVKDVDQNTYIIPETAPGANENVLYFFNDNNNTVRLTTTELQFDTVDTIVSSTSDEFEITASLMTFDNASTTLDNTAASRTFLHTSKQYFDLGLSSGLNVDPLLRLENNGDIFYNLGFGTGTFTGIKLFDSEFKNFELKDYGVRSETFTLIKGTSEQGSAVLYNSPTEKGGKVIVLCKNTTSGKRSMAEFNVIDNGTDIFHNEFGSLNTSADAFTSAFDFTPGNDARITLTLTSDHSNGDNIEFTVVTHIYK